MHINAASSSPTPSETSFYLVASLRSLSSHRRPAFPSTPSFFLVFLPTFSAGLSTDSFFLRPLALVPSPLSASPAPRRATPFAGFLAPLTNFVQVPAVVRATAPLSCFFPAAVAGGRLFAPGHRYARRNRTEDSVSGLAATLSACARDGRRRFRWTLIFRRRVRETLRCSTKLGARSRATKRVTRYFLRQHIIGYYLPPPVVKGLIADSLI